MSLSSFLIAARHFSLCCSSGWSQAALNVAGSLTVGGSVGLLSLDFCIVFERGLDPSCQALHGGVGVGVLRIDIHSQVRCVL